MKTERHVACERANEVGRMPSFSFPLVARALARCKRDLARAFQCLSRDTKTRQTLSCIDWSKSGTNLTSLVVFLVKSALIDKPVVRLV